MAKDVFNNSAQAFIERIRTDPDQEAFRWPLSWNGQEVTRYAVMTYQEFEDRIKSYQTGLFSIGLKPKAKVLFLFIPDLEFYCLLAAVIAAGMTVIFIDPSMGLRKIIQAIKGADADLIISVKRLIKYRFLLPPLWGKRLYSADQTGFGVKHLRSLIKNGRDDVYIYPCEPEHNAVIAFTSGSTGRPKGAQIRHENFIALHEANTTAGYASTKEIEMTYFTGMPLINLGYGWTTVFPAIEKGRQPKINTSLVVSEIARLQVTRIAFPPYFMEKIITYIHDNQIVLPSLKNILVGGSTVSNSLCQKILSALPQATTEIIYGSTEAEPISRTSAAEVVKSKGQGHLVGKPIPQIEVKIVNLPDKSDGFTEERLASCEVTAGQIGEILVKGKIVLKGYVNNPEATKKNKIPCEDGLVWHRTGDTGYLDIQGRIWLTGPLTDTFTYKGKKIYPYIIEMIVDEIKGVSRSALILLPKESSPVLAVKLEKKNHPDDVMERIREYLATCALNETQVCIIDDMPLDYRHNSKIDRPKLRKVITTSRDDK